MIKIQCLEKYEQCADDMENKVAVDSKGSNGLIGKAAEEVGISGHFEKHRFNDQYHPEHDRVQQQHKDDGGMIRTEDADQVGGILKDDFNELKVISF